MILVTGGTGFVGRALVEHLTKQGSPVRVLTRKSSSPWPEPVQLAAGDLTEPDSLAAALGGVHRVVHLAAALGGEAARLQALNVQGTEALARAARAAGVRQFVQVSSAGVYGDGDSAAPHRESDPPSPRTPYERSKLAAEAALAAALAGSPVSWIILRPAGVYGSERPATAEFFRRVRHRPCWFHGPARVLVHPTYIDDLVAAIARALAQPELHGEIINVGGERALEFRELVQLVGNRVGHRPLQLSLPYWSAAFGRRWVNRALNIEKARSRLHFEPVALEWGLDTTVTGLREKGVL